MAINRLVLLAAAAIALLPVGPALSAELVYGSWTPAQEYQNRVAMPDVFKMIEAETKRRDQVEARSRAARSPTARRTFTAVKDGLMQAGLGIVDLCAERDPVGLRDLFAPSSSARTIRSPPPWRRSRPCICTARPASRNARSYNA